jgi:predicted amidohydrolase
MSSKLNVALIQSSLHWQDKAANFKHFSQLLPQAKGADLILLPEMFSTGFSMEPQHLFDEPAGETLKWLQNEAQKLQAAICGSVIIKEQGQYFNRLYFVLPTGQFYTYNKRHLFTLAGEEKVYQPGKQKLVISYLGWRINPQICYDLRFPAWCRNQENFDLQLFVANWPQRRNNAWKSLLSARAIENQCYVAGLNRVGPDGNKVDHSGDSKIIDPLGETILACTPHQTEVKMIALEKSSLQKVRSKLAFLNDRDSFLIT